MYACCFASLSLDFSLFLSLVLLTAHAFDLHKLIKLKLIKLREKQVCSNATVPAAMLRHRHTSARNLRFDLCFHIMREEAVLSIQLLSQIRDKLLQAFFVEAFSSRTFSSVSLTCTCVIIPSITTKTQENLVPILGIQRMKANKKARHTPRL